MSEGPRSPLEALGALAAQEVEVTDSLRHVEVYTVGGLLTMLWQNLLANAIKFRHPDRTPVVRITCERVDAEDDAAGWEFSVSDNGIGIPAEFAEKVFVIFQRLHARDVYTGTGIGLAVCRKIVDYHGGNIWIDTTWTEGARVCFTLVGAKTQAELGSSGAAHPADLPGAARS
jgi:light-regulated signal transduction histidine kinase (bacteriophytochrome)